MNRAQLGQLTKLQIVQMIYNETGEQIDPEKYTKDQLLDLAAARNLLDDSPVQSVAGASAPKGRFDGATHVTVNLIRDDDTLNYVMVSDSNGNMCQVMKGVDVTLPIDVFHTLNDAIETVYKPRNTEGGSLVMDPTKRHRFPFSIVEVHGN